MQGMLRILGVEARGGSRGVGGGGGEGPIVCAGAGREGGRGVILSMRHAPRLSPGRAREGVPWWLRRGGARKADYK